MPIYAYKCTSCGHAKDVLQKVSDAPLKTCPACGADTLAKQITAAGFQLKGSGWYATDFRGGGASSPAAADKHGESKGDGPPAAAKGDAPVASAGGCGASSACH
jgi:putative FmdB family regulatory protein